MREQYEHEIAKKHILELQNSENSNPKFNFDNFTIKTLDNSASSTTSTPKIPSEPNANLKGLELYPLHYRFLRKTHPLRTGNFKLSDISSLQWAANTENTEIIKKVSKPSTPPSSPKPDVTKIPESPVDPPVITEKSSFLSAVEELETKKVTDVKPSETNRGSEEFLSSIGVKNSYSMDSEFNELVKKNDEILDELMKKCEPRRGRSYGTEKHLGRKRSGERDGGDRKCRRHERR